MAQRWFFDLFFDNFNFFCLEWALDDLNILFWSAGYRKGWEGMGLEWRGGARYGRRGIVGGAGRVVVVKL